MSLKTLPRLKRVATLPCEIFDIILANSDRWPRFFAPTRAKFYLLCVYLLFVKVITLVLCLLFMYVSVLVARDDICYVSESCLMLMSACDF